MNMQKFAGRGLGSLLRNAGWAKLGWLCLAGWMINVAQAQPANDNFASAFVITGSTGTTNGSNVGATMEPCELPFINGDDFADLDNSVWFAWTAPSSAIAEFDTIGSGFDTALAVFTTPTGLCDPNIAFVAENDDITNGVQTSQVNFYVVAGTTYYISVNGNADTGFPFDQGNYVLNWNLTGLPTVPSGTFLLTSTAYTVSELDSTARITVTRAGAAHGRVLVDYQVSALTYTNIFRTNYYGTNVLMISETTNGIFTTNSTFTTTVASGSYEYFAGGYFYVSTNSASTNGVSGYTNILLDTNGVPIATNTFSSGGGGPLNPAPSNAPPYNLTTNTILLPGSRATTNVDLVNMITNIVINNVFVLPSAAATNIVSSNSRFTLSSGTLAFDDYQMSQDITVRLTQSLGPVVPVSTPISSLVAVTISNPRLDPQESPDLEPPVLAPASSRALLSALSTTFPPGPSLFNFANSIFQVAENVVSKNITISVLRSPGSTGPGTVDYRIDYGPSADSFHTFPLQAGSDYATPNVDYASVTGTLSWGVGDFNPKTFSIPITNDTLVEFNEDMQLQLFNPQFPANGTDPGNILGAISTATLTILFDDQPAGAVDRNWNVENSFVPYPGTVGYGGTVYAVAEQPNGSAIIAGSFNSFNQAPYNRIVRLLSNGSADTSFLAAPNSGANDFIAALALQPDGNIIIGGNFTAFNGNNRHYIARLNSDGTLDSTFNPGLGANGTVWSIALETSVQNIFGFALTNVQVIIAGDFTSVNGINLNHVARLNMDGSVDTSFNPGFQPGSSPEGVGPDGTVNAVAVDAIGRVVIGGDFDTVSGVISGGVARLNVDGSVDTTFAPGIGTYNSDTLDTDPVYALAVQPNGQILIAGGFSYLDLNSYNGIARLNPDGTVDLNFNPGTGTLNPITSIADTLYAMTLQPDGTILIGGNFTTFNQTRRVGVARLLTDGSLDTSFMDTAYNQFAGLINHYHNPDAVNMALYPPTNARNYVYALALEAGGNVILGGNFYYVGGGSTRDATHPRSNVARLIGGVTPGPGNIQFSQTGYTVDKPQFGTNAFPDPITLERDNGSLGIISATFSTNTAAPGPGIAVPNVDFSLSTAYTMPTWGTTWSVPGWMYSYGSSGQSSSTRVSIFNKGKVTGNLNLNFALANPSGTNFTLGGEYIPLGAALGSQITAPLTIIDVNTHPGVLGFAQPTYSVTANGVQATIAVTRTNGTDGVVQVSYVTSDGTAVNHTDYNTVTNTLTFGIGVASQTFTIPIINRASTQPDKTVNLRLYTPTGGATLGLTNAVLTIINSTYTAGHVGFVSATFATNENSGSAIITINRLGGSTGTLKVTVLTSDGSAVNGVNYIGSTNVITWNTGQAWPTNILIPVMDDSVVTSNLTVNLRLTNATINTQFSANLLALSQFTNATLFINNVDSAGTVQFGSPVYSVKKYGGFALIPVVRTGGTVGTVSVQFTTADGTAFAGANYTATNGVLNFANGEVGKFFAVPIIDNGISNGPVFLNLMLSNATPGYALGSPSKSVLNIIDTGSVDETPGQGDITYDSLGLNNTAYAMVLQPNNQLLVGGDFTMAGGVPRQRIARLNSDGSVDAGFSLPSSQYGANDSVRTLALQADGRILVGGFFTNFNSVVLNHIARLNSDGTLDSQFTPGSAADNAVYALAETFVSGFSKIMIGGGFATVGGTSINAIARLNSDGSLDANFNPGTGANATVYALAVQGDGKVVTGGDFTTVNGNTHFNHIARLNTDGSVDSTFNPGIGASDSVHAIVIQSDGKILIGGYFTNVNGVALNHIARLNMDGSVDGAFQPGVGASDAVFSIALQSDARIVLGGEFTSCSGVTRNRVTRLYPNGSVDPTINFGTGANNFVAAIAIQEDTIFGYPTNVPDEKIIIGGGFTQYNGQPHAYLARIYGGSISGVGAYEFSSANYQVDERGTNVVITILRTGGTSGTNADGSGDIFVPFTTSDGTAVAGTNYLAVTDNLDFPEGEVIRTVTIPVLDDGVITPDLTVNLALNPALPAAFGNQPVATLTIINDDSAVEFSSATYTVAKNAINGAGTINILRLGSTSGTSTVAFNTATGGTATMGTDYTPVSQMVVFNPGVSNVLVTVPIINNGVAEGNQTVDLQLTGATGSALYSPSNAVLTIIDTVHTPGQLSFSAPSYVITEGGGVGYTNAYITVVRVNGSLGTVTARFSTMDGTAVAGVKYIPTNGTVSFGEGEMGAKTFAVQVRNTPTAEGPEYLNLLLTNVTGGAVLVAPTNATLTILNTNIGIAFGAATYAVTESYGFMSGVTLSVVRFNTTNTVTTVNYATTNGTALAGTNFVATSGTLTFNPGDSVKTITVPLLYDPRVTGDLIFTVGLSNPSGSAQLTPPSTATVIVHDADAGLSFLASAMNVAKSAGSALIAVVCSNPSVEPVSVNYSTSPGTAQPGVDYTSTSGTLVLTNGAAIGYFTVPIVPNNLAQSSNRTFTVSLSNPTPPGQLLPPVTETITIIETNTPLGLSFFSPIVTKGDWGSTNASNIAGAADNGTPNIAGSAPNAPVWFQWTAPANGEVSLDTIGSLATNGIKLDTVLAVFTGSALNGLNQVAANDDLYPLPFPPYYGQYNETAQNIYNINGLSGVNFTNNRSNGGFNGGNGDTNSLNNLVLSEFLGGLYLYYQPFGGPSGLRFNATAGTTYYIVADSKPNYIYTYLLTPPYYVLTDIGRGTISLNWAYHPSGVFRFASENVAETGITGTNGNPILLYQAAETESSLRGLAIGSGNAGHYDDVFAGYNNHFWNPSGLLVTVTRVAGSSGRMAVDYTTVDGDASVTANGDLAAVAYTDYDPVSGTLVFDDYEMSKTLLIPIVDDAQSVGILNGGTILVTGLGVPEPNRDFKVVLSNPRRDPVESSDVSAPRVDPIFGTVLCRILDCDIDPYYGPSTGKPLLVTNIDPVLLVTNVITNAVYSLTPTNPIFNFAKSSFRVPRDVQSYWGASVGVFVNRFGTNTADATVYYTIDGYFDTAGDADYENYVFPLQPGSDYATPPGGNNNAGIFQSLKSDFNPVNGASGTLTFKAKKTTSQPVLLNITDNNLTEFNEDIHLSIFEEDKDGNTYQCGMVDECTLTILFDDLSPPAGSVDEFWNPDYSDAMVNNQNGSVVAYPGTEALSEIYSLAVTPNNQTVIGGAFSTYSDKNNTYTVNGIARLNFDGSLDTTFSSGVGINVHPGNEFIRSIALSGNQLVVGGHFSSFEGYSRGNIARLNGDGSVDTTFNPGVGANGTIWSVLAQTDGRVLIGGDFTSYNGAARNHVARLNSDGSLDTTFDPNNILSGPVYSMSLDSPTFFNLTRFDGGGTNEDDQAINLGNFTAGTLTVDYNFLAMTNDLRVFYGDTNVTAGTGVLIYDTGNRTNGPVTFMLPFGPIGGLTTNLLTIVMNQGNSTNGATAWMYTASVSAPRFLVVGGLFNVAGQSYVNLARLNLDGSLDNTFTNLGSGMDNAVWALDTQPNGQIVAGGAFTHVNGSAYNRLVRLNADGSWDPNFYVGTGADNIIYNIMHPQPGSLYYLGGAFTTVNGTHRLGFARLNADGTVDTSFMDTAYNQFAGLTRIHFNDPPGTVYSSGIQNDGNVMIAGSFAQVGGGQFDGVDIRPGDYGLDPNLGVFLNQNVWPEPKTREGVRNRGNVARLIGGATPGPGNIGLATPSYAANKSQSFESVSLIRTNGNLGYASANFSVQPGLARSGVDYSYGASAPIYPIGWEYEGPTRVHSDGLTGANTFMLDQLGPFYVPFALTGPASIVISIINNTASSGNLSAQFQVANPDPGMFYLGGELIPLGVALGQLTAPLTIVDNSHQDGVFGFTSSSYTATNSPATVGLGRASSSFGTVQVSYRTTTNGTAVSGTDYQPASGVVTFNSGQTNNSFPVTILNNSYIASVEKTVGLQLYNLQDLSSGNATMGLTNAVLRLINPNYQGYLNLTTNLYSASLSSGAITLIVTRTVGSKGSLTVQYATTNGTAISGVNYVGSTNTLSWNNGDVSPRVVTILLLNNNLIGPNKQFGVNLYNPGLNGVSTSSLFATNGITSATLLIINDNNYGTFQWSSPAYLVNENGGFATVTVTRTGSALGAASVNFATANGTAFAGTNYVPTNGSLAFAQGQIAQSFTVRILNDGVTNPPPGSFFFNVALSDPSTGAALGSPASAVVNIVDAQTYNQPSGSPDVAFSPVAAMNNSVLALAVQSGGQIVAGGNFSIVNGTAMNHLARLNTDGTLDTTFLNGLAGADGSVNALISQADDRILVGGAFDQINGITRYRIARLMTDGTLDTSFNPGSGVDNSVFSLAQTYINGSRVAYLGGVFSTVNGISLSGIARLNDDGSVDSTFVPGLGANGPVYAVAAYSTNSVYDAGQVLVGGAFSNFNNYAVGNLVRLNVNGSVDTNFDLNLGANGTVRAIAIQTDGGVLIGGDFTKVNGTTLNHIARLNPDGSLDAAFAAKVAASFNGVVDAISVQADNRIVLAGDFTQASGVTRHSITRLMPDGTVDPTINFGDGANGAINALVIQPADGMLVIGGGFTQFNDQPHDHIARLYGGSMTGSGAFEFSLPAYQADENGGYAYVTIRRTGGTSGANADGSGDIFIQFATSNGTAVAGVNYSSVAANVDFPMGEVLQTIQIPVMDDFVITPGLTVNLALSNPTPPAGVGDQTTAILTIVNDDAAVSFSSVNYSVPKNTATGVGTINVIRQGSTSGSCTVDFATTYNGTAVAGVDYYPTNSTVTFNVGDSNETVQVPVINNGIPEGNRTVTMQLANAVGALVYAPSNATLTIIDTVFAPGELSFATDSYSVVKGNTNVYLTVVRANGSSGAVAVNYNTVPGTATPGLNYQTTSGTLTLNDGAVSNTIAIPIVDNNLVQGPVNFSVVLSNPSGGATLVPPTNAVVTIIEKNIGLAFTAATNTASETASFVLLNVERLYGANSITTVHYATTNGTALANVNYIAVSGTLTFNPGESVKSIVVPLIYDTNVTGNLTFTVGLSSPGAPAQLMSPSFTTVVIEDANAGLSFTAAAMNVFKNAGSALITVVCSNPDVEPVIVDSSTVPLSVNYATSDGTAVAGQNYLAVSGTLVFTNGIATNTFVVPIINDANVTGDRTFTVTLSNPTAPGQLIPPSTETVTIIDGNSGLKFSSPTYTVLKTSPAATINVIRTGYTDSVVSVSYIATNGTAIPGLDYAPTAGLLVFTNGVTNQTFTVQVVDNPAVQPDKTVLLQLFGPVGGVLVPPSAATLTIHDNTGSYVVPAGSALVSESGAGAPNGVIDSNETVSILFAFRDSGGTNVADLKATLLATNGITSPTSPNSTATQDYGPLAYLGHSAFRQFTFTAHGTNGQQIAATFVLTNGASNLGTAIFGYTLGSWTTTYSNTAPIYIPNTIYTSDEGPASPYPSVINVSGLSGTVVKTTLTWNNVTHTSPSDIDALLVAPNQLDTLFMAHAGGVNAMFNVTLKFDDAATNSLPQFNQITNGVYKPTGYLPVPNFP